MFPPRQRDAEPTGIPGIPHRAFHARWDDASRLHPRPGRPRQDLCRDVSAISVPLAASGDQPQQRLQKGEEEEVVKMDGWEKKEEKEEGEVVFVKMGGLEKKKQKEKGEE